MEAVHENVENDVVARWPRIGRGGSLRFGWQSYGLQPGSLADGQRNLITPGHGRGHGHPIIVCRRQAPLSTII